MTAVVPPIQLRCFRRIQAYPITKTNVPSPLGTILLILKRKRPFLYGKMGQNRAKLKNFLGPCDSRVHSDGIFRRPGS